MHQSVDTEVAVVGVITKVATVGPVFLARAALGEQALILEVPDKLTRQTGIFFIQVEHLAHITHGVTHGVRVLTLDMRLRVGFVLT